MRTTPDLRRVDSLQIEPGDNTIVTATTLQSPEQIGQVRLVHVGQRTVREHHLVVDHAVAGPADLVTVEADTTGQKKTGDTHGADTTAGDGETMGLEVAIDVVPSVRGTNGEHRVVVGQVHGRQVGENDQHTIVDAVCSLFQLATFACPAGCWTYLNTHMATTTHGKRSTRFHQLLQSLGQLTTRLRPEHAVGRQNLGIGPEVLLLILVDQRVGAVDGMRHGGRQGLAVLALLLGVGSRQEGEGEKMG